MTYKEMYERNLINGVLKSIERHGGGKCLSSVILTGSLGRDEATYVLDPAGNLCLKSDVEIALVYPDAAAKRTVGALMREVAAEFEEDLNLMAISEKRVRGAYNYNCSLKTPRRKTLFTYDLFNGSRTVWGRDWIGQKQFGLDRLDLYEAKRLVANRIGELVYLTATADDTTRCDLIRQWKGKLVLAIAGARLILEGDYVSSYCGQYERMRKRQNTVDRSIGEHFFADYEKVFFFLRKGGMPYEVKDEKLREYVWCINRFFQARSLHRPRVNNTARLAKYFAKYSRAGLPYGVFRFEDKILQGLIDGYYIGKPQLPATADVWHRVLY